MARSKTFTIYSFIAICIAFYAGADVVEEFAVRGPNELHSIAVNTFLEERRKNPEIKDMGDDSPIMLRAKEHAIKRFVAQDENDLMIMKPLSDSGDKVLALPSPDDQQSFLTAAVTTRGASQGVISQEELSAMQVEIGEDIGMGAISKAGALPMGDSMEWVKFVEDKLRRDNRVDHQSLLWELGSEVAETEQVSSGGMNISLEEELMDNFTAWFEAGGGKLKYVQPVISKENGIKLVASEDIHEGEGVVQVPVKLTMSRISARNVLIKNKSKYLGEELKKTFEKNEVWALSIFLLHEWYKETAGSGSKWGPYLRTLRMRSLTTPALRALQGTRAIELSKQWFKSSNDLRFYSTGSEGPCSPTTGICNTKPNDKFAGTRFEMHQMRWAYWVVKQNAVRVHHTSTGQSFLALVPFFNMIEKRVDSGGGVSFDLDGGVTIRVGTGHEEGEIVGTHPGNFTDTEFFMRFLSVPKGLNPYNSLSMSLPGALPEGSDYHICLKMADQDKKRKCKGDKGQDLMWKMKTLSEWRKAMNLPPRLGDLRLWATRLHLYGDDEEEQKKLSAANQLLAGLPVSTDDIPAEDQLMLLGIAQNNDEAMAMVAGSNRPPPQLYSAPDPEEDPEAQRAMENLATLAAQVHMVVSTGNIIGNATRAVLNQTREFFQHGVIPKAGLDELDDFILKKIGMLAHCGVDKAMKITHGNISKELMCAMRVHLMNETEMNVFCPADAKVFHENCQNVEFMNYTAISVNNELNVIEAFRSTLYNLLSSYPTSPEEDRAVLREAEQCEKDCEHGPIYLGAIRLRLREKELLQATLDFLDDHENKTVNNEIPFQLDIKRQEREIADRIAAEHAAFVAEIKRLAAEKLPLAVVPVDLGGDKPKINLTLLEGHDIKDTVISFCRQNNVPSGYVNTLESALRKQIVNPPPLLLLLGVVSLTGERHVLGIPEGKNASIETGVFCARSGIDQEECDNLQKRVESRLSGADGAYTRRIIGTLNVDAPDGRKLMFVIRESEQHDLIQYTSDFLEYYKMHSMNAVNILANEMHKRLPEPALRIPVSLPHQRSVEIRFSRNDNITAVVAGFVDFYELDEGAKTQILRLARDGMSPGTFMV